MDEHAWNILLIEDDINDRMIIQYFLAEGDGERCFAIETAETLRDAQRMLAHGSFDAVLLDLALPDSRGIEALLGVRSHAPEVPVIVLTGLKDEAVARDALSLGAQDYLIKGMINSYYLKRAITFAIERVRASPR